MDDKKQTKLVIKKIGKKHIEMVREAFGDRLTLSWLHWEKNILGGRTPIKAVLDGDADKVRGMIAFLYDLSTLPSEEDDVEDEEFSELDTEEVEIEE